MLPGKGFFRSPCGFDRRWGAAKCHGSAISPLLVPAAWAVGEDKACAYLQQPCLLPLFLSSMSAGAASACARHPCVLEGFSRQEQPGPGPSLLSGVLGDPICHRASQALGPIPQHSQHLSTSPLPTSPSSVSAHADSLQERSLPETALFSERLTSSRLLWAGDVCEPSNKGCGNCLA